MAREFELELGYYAPAQELQQVAPTPEPKPQLKPWQFVSDFQQMVGEESEPDPLFFVETWTLGAAAAMENFRQRQLQKSGHDARATMFRQFSNLAHRFVELEKEASSDQLRPAQIIEERQKAHRGTSAQPQLSASQEWASFAEEFVSVEETAQPMTQDHARRLLGVTVKSTHEQLRAAYRRMVTDWHPDRLGARTEKVRQQATEKMAVINEAYRLLRDTLSKAV
jgi:DnaJ-domain-containing protein 1